VQNLQQVGGTGLLSWVLKGRLKKNMVFAKTRGMFPRIRTSGGGAKGGKKKGQKKKCQRDHAPNKGVPKTGEEEEKRERIDY